MAAGQRLENDTKKETVKLGADCDVLDPFLRRFQAAEMGRRRLAMIVL